MRLTTEKLAGLTSAKARLKLLSEPETWGEPIMVPVIAMKIWRLEMPGGDAILATWVAGEFLRDAQAVIHPIIRYKHCPAGWVYSGDEIGILGADELLRRRAEEEAGKETMRRQEAMRRYKR